MNTDIQRATGEGIAQKAREVQALVKGKPYTPAGKSLSGFDCSGFVSFVFASLFTELGAGFYMRAVGYSNSKWFNEVTSPQAGDVIFFPAHGGAVDHVGIVVNTKEWVGSQSGGVLFVGMNDHYWSKRPHKFFRYTGSSPLAMQSFFTSCGRLYA